MNAQMYSYFVKQQNKSTMKNNNRYLITEKPNKHGNMPYIHIQFEIISALVSGKSHFLKKLVHPEAKTFNNVPVMRFFEQLTIHYLNSLQHNYIVDYTYHISMDKYPGSDAIKFSFLKHPDPNYPQTDEDGFVDYSFVREECELIYSFTLVPIYKDHLIYDIRKIKHTIDLEELEKYIMEN
jgi:hypothetical protein